MKIVRLYSITIIAVLGLSVAMGCKSQRVVDLTHIPKKDSVEDKKPEGGNPGGGNSGGGLGDGKSGGGEDDTVVTTNNDNTTDTDSKLKLSRLFQVIRVKDNKTVFRSNVDYVCINLDNYRPTRMPSLFKEAYKITSI